MEHRILKDVNIQISLDIKADIKLIMIQDSIECLVIVKDALCDPVIDWEDKLNEAKLALDKQSLTFLKRMVTKMMLQAAKDKLE